LLAVLLLLIVRRSGHEHIKIRMRHTYKNA